MTDKFITREELEEVLENTPLNEFSRKDFQIAVDYYLENKYTSDTEILYEKIIEKNGEEFFKELKELDKKIVEDLEIYNLISFLSLAPLNEKKMLIESPILKTIRAIPSITNVFILYTEDSKKRFEELKEYLKSQDIDIIGKSIDIDNINESYQFLQEIVKAEGLDKSNTVLDSTLGLRMFGIALYKIAVERGLNLIAWRDYQLPKYIKEKEGYKLEKNKTERIPFLAKLTLLQEPKFENAKIYRALIKELKSFNFSGAASYYNTLGLTDLKILCQDFENVFGLKSILEFDSNKFYNSLEIVLKKILNYDVEEEKNQEIIKLITLKLLPLVNYKNILKGINSFNIKIEDVDSYICKLSLKDERIKIKIYYSFVLNYLRAKLGDEAIDNPYVQNIISEIFSWDKKKIKIESIEEILSVLFSDLAKENIEKNSIGVEIKIQDIFNIADNLIDDVEIPIQVSKNILKISKYSLNIDLLEEERNRINLKELKDKEYIFTKKTNITKKIGYNSIAIPLIKLLNGEMDELDVNDLNQIYGVKESTFSRYKSELKHIIKLINDIVNDELEKKSEEKKDIIIIENEKKIDTLEKKEKKDSKIKRIRINEFFK